MCLSEWVNCVPWWFIYNYESYWCHCRGLWALAVTTMLGSMIYTLYSMLAAYDQYPVNTLTKVTTKTSLPFPGVTLCNINEVDMNKVSFCFCIIILCLSVCLSVCLCLCLFVCLSVCQSVCLSVCLCLFLSGFTRSQMFATFPQNVLLRVAYP